VLWVLVMLIRTTRSVVLISLASVDVSLTGALVVATGNHYPLDLVAGAALVAIVVPVTHPWDPERRDRFAARLGPLGKFLRAHAVLTD
jgi:membrane-associated phospholipid phosphatase